MLRISVFFYVSLINDTNLLSCTLLFYSKCILDIERLFHLSIFILGSIMFHVRRRPADSHGPRRRKKKSNVSNGNSSHQHDREGPTLVEVTHSGDGGRRVKLTSEPLEVISHNKY